MATQLHYPTGLHDHRPPKRLREAFDPDDGLHPYSSAPALTPSAAHPDPDSASDNNAKKTRKRPLSCGECRRLKLKCDRIFPCQSCVKRGCAEICPEGALTGGKGSRFILANTEQLHEKIKAMSERIRQLEEGLQALQAQHSAETHPLLRQELLHIKRSPELFGMDRNGTSAANTSDNHRREEDDHPSVGSSSLPEGMDDTPSFIHSAQYPGIPTEIARLSRAFPVPASLTSELDPHLRQRIRDMLPPQPEASRICEQARLNAFWHYNPDGSESLIPNLLHSVYTTPLSELMPHRLSLFLMILAIGSIVDLDDEQNRQESEKYHHLARAALCEVPVIDDPSFDTINSLFYMIWYLLMFSHHKKAVEHAWGVMGIVAKLALSLGLHRDAVRTKMIPEELDKRKTLFWNLLNVDVRLALMLRRPPSLYMRYMDAKPPVYNLDLDSSSNISAHYHAWRDAFLAQCMIPVMDISITPQPAGYSDILGWDWKIRDFNIPPNLRMTDKDGLAPNHPVGMQQALTLLAREVAILNLHRNCFTQALNIPQGFTAKHKYAPSVYAVYSSARNLIWATHTVYKWEPELTVRMSWIWQNELSAVIALCLLISCAPACPLAPRALAELDQVLSLFADIRDRSPAAAKALPVMEDTFSRTRSVYDRWRSGYSGSATDDDGLCQIARRTGLFLPADGTHTPADGDADPFENAHPALRRCAEQAAVEGPRSPRLDFPGPRASLFGTSQTYSTSAERTGGGNDHELSDAAAPSTMFGRGMAWSGAEFQDSSWMTWF
ncbi:hypothetical protein B0H21DRAFT_866625 [Amylocystis lapponica]|nr:hypothetical protein B0H21DRAFT_866625 [Amylocystis lapponica]